MRAFTLLETCIVLAILTALGSIGLVGGMDVYIRALSRNDTLLIRDLLVHARAESMTDECSGNQCIIGMPHGLLLQPGKAILFEGASYDARTIPQDIIFSLSFSTQIPDTEQIVFNATSGTVTTPTELHFGSTTVSVNSEGAITE